MRNRMVFRPIAKYILENLPIWPAGVLLGCLLLFPATRLIASIAVLVTSLGAAVVWSTRVPGLLASLTWLWRGTESDLLKYVVPLALQWRRLMEGVGLAPLVERTWTYENDSLAERWKRRRWQSRQMPTLRSCVGGLIGPEVVVTLPPGITLGDLIARTDQIKDVWGVEAVRMRQELSREVIVTGVMFDPLSEPIPAPETVASVDLHRLPLGIREDGADWLHDLPGNHLLVVSSSGGGKSGLLWSLTRAVSPEVRKGAVQIWSADLKGGVETVLARGIFSRRARTFAETLALLRELNKLLEERLAFMEATEVRLHVANRESPHILLIIDEAASLEYLKPDSKSGAEAKGLLARILSVGRASGITVVAALQNPRKEDFWARDLFVTVIALRLRTRADVELALGTDAYAAGAQAELIPRNSPGVGFVIEQSDGSTPVRVRSYWLDDIAVRALQDPCDEFPLRILEEGHGDVERN
jgi:hypothetical protein